MRISSKTKLCIIVGDPIEHSLSPAMHNAAYEALGIDDQFVYTAARVNVKNIKNVVEAVRAMSIRGLTCTIPHKVEVLKYLDELDETAQKIGAANTIVNENGKLKGYNTDWVGVLIPLEKITSLLNKKVAVIGAGGAARAMIYACLSKDAQVTVFNRTQEMAELLAKKVFNSTGQKITVHSLDDIESVTNSDIILNATSLGMGELKDQTPVPVEFLRPNHIVFDAVYSPHNTRLLSDAQKVGATVIHGVEMLLHQGTAQFELYTGHKAPEEVMRKILYNHLHITH